MPASPTVLDYVRRRIERYKTECVLPEAQLLLGLMVYGGIGATPLLDEIIEEGESSVALGDAAEKLRAVAADSTRIAGAMLVWLSICLVTGKFISQPPFMLPAERAALERCSASDDDLVAQLGGALNALLRPDTLRA